MNFIIPMAGKGSRLRPHTLLNPKPFFKIAGKTLVERLLEDLAKNSATEKIEKIGFVIGDLNAQQKQHLTDIALRLGAEPYFYQQKEALGTAHAVFCASELLQGKVIVAFADTLFQGNIALDTSAEGSLWVKAIEDPSAFGVVKLDQNGVITDYVEKPKTFVSDLAMIGVYYFKHAEQLKTELAYLIDNQVIKSGEYQLPDALRRLTEKGVALKTTVVQTWLDCGNAEATLQAMESILQAEGSQVHKNAKIIDSIIIEPCFIADGVVLERVVVGPFVSLEEGVQLKNTNISHSIVHAKTALANLSLLQSVIGEMASLAGKKQKMSVGDYSKIDM